MKQFEWQKLGPLDVLCRPSQELQKESKAVILLHGYGADASDLASLSQYWDPEGVHSWYFPDGFVTTSFGGKAWFEIDYRALEQALAAGQSFDFSERTPPGLSMAHEMVSQSLVEIVGQHETYILGGFSQGSMVTVDVMLGSALSPERMILLSGAPIDLARWRTLDFRNPEQKFFQCHGRMDQVIDISKGKKLNEFLLSKNAKGPFEPFDGGHEIPLGILDKLKPMIMGNRKQSR